MKIEGPGLEHLMRRLTEAPDAVLAEPHIKSSNRGVVRLGAVVHDLATRLDEEAHVSARRLRPYEILGGKKQVNWARLVSLACWLLHDEWFVGRPSAFQHALTLFRKDLEPLSKLVDAMEFVQDPDRREEFVRVVLARLGARPEGETLKQANDRLDALDTVQRHEVLKKAAAAREHARKLEEELRKKRAAEAAAARYNGE